MNFKIEYKKPLFEHLSEHFLATEGIAKFEHTLMTLTPSQASVIKKMKEGDERLFVDYDRKNGKRIIYLMPSYSSITRSIYINLKKLNLIETIAPDLYSLTPLGRSLKFEQ